MATTVAKPGFIGVEENPAATVERQSAGKNCLVEAPTGARSVRADWEEATHGSPPDKAGEARRTL